MPIITSLAALHIISANDIFVFNRTWDTDVSTFNLQTALVDAGWDGIKMVRANLVVNSGIVISSNTTAQAAITIPTLPNGSVVNILNNGYIIGMGGRGGGSTISPTGENGGAAMNVAAPCSITNNGTIGGGGGGGGASASTSGGGGGRSGRTNSAGGTATGSPGGAGTFTSAGAGGVYGSRYIGGNGGNWGAAGGTASGGDTNYAGGAGGAAVIGNSNVTWLTTGTIMGALV